MPVSSPQVSVAGYGMDEAEQDQYEARLKELFDSFDSTGTGSLGQEELTDLYHVLHLEEVAPVLQQTLLQGNLLGRVRPGWALVVLSPWTWSPWRSCFALPLRPYGFKCRGAEHVLLALGDLRARRGRPCAPALLPLCWAGLLPSEPP